MTEALGRQNVLKMYEKLAQRVYSLERRITVKPTEKREPDFVPPMACMWRSSTQTLPNEDMYEVTLNSTVYQSVPGMVSGTGIVAPVAGLYEVGFRLFWPESGTSFGHGGRRFGIVYLNGDISGILGAQNSAGTDTEWTQVQHGGTVAWQMNAGDKITLNARYFLAGADTGGYDLLSFSGKDVPRMWMHWIREPL